MIVGLCRTSLSLSYIILARRTPAETGPRPHRPGEYLKLVLHNFGPQHSRLKLDPQFIAQENIGLVQAVLGGIGKGCPNRKRLLVDLDSQRPACGSPQKVEGAPGRPVRGDD